MGDLAEDEIGRRGPDERLWRAIVRGDVVEDGLAQVGDGAEIAAADRLVGNLGEPAFDLVEPGTVRGNEVQMEPGMARQPAAHRRSLVGGVVVEHEVKVQTRRHAFVDLFEEADEVALSVARLAATDDLAGLHSERRKQRDGAMPEVIVRGALGPAGTERQDGLRAFQCLALALLIDAEHEGALRGL